MDAYKEIIYELECKVCKFSSPNLDEVCYYDINGWSYSDEMEIERNAQNADALAHKLCVTCAEEFDFNNW